MRIKKERRDATCPRKGEGGRKKESLGRSEKGEEQKMRGARSTGGSKDRERNRM